MRNAAVAVAGDRLGNCIYEDTLFLQDVGLDRLGEREELLRSRYSGIDHPAAREIVAWLDGEYHMSDARIREMAGNDQG
jgi:hypothetical protein